MFECVFGFKESTHVFQADGSFVARQLLRGFFLIVNTSLSAQEYDLVLSGGRVINPGSGTDAICNVGIPFVNGTFLVRDYTFIEDAYPGQPVRGAIR